jgi:hypothetical protein
VIHRVIGGDGDTGYQLQGDNNSWVDPWRPTDRDVVGKAWYRMPGASKWLLTLMHPVVAAAVVTALLAWSAASSKKKRAAKPHQLAASSRRNMKFDDYLRAFAAVSGRTRAVAALCVGAACLLSVPAALAWLDDAERTSFREDASYVQSADTSYTFRLDPTTLYPDGTVGPVDASSPPPPKVFALPARTLDVVTDYRVEGVDAETSGSYVVDAVLTGDAGWQLTIPVVDATPFVGTQSRVEVPIDLGEILATAKRIDEESGTMSRVVEVTLQPRFDLAATAAGLPVKETFAAPVTIAHDGSTWAVTSELHTEQSERLGEEVTERVELAGLPVELVRWSAIPAGALLILGVAIVAVAMRRTDSLTIEALLRRPGISVIDLEQPPADADLAVPLANPEGIRRVAERDGGLVLRYDEGGNVRLYARHDERVYSFTPGSTNR